MIEASSQERHVSIRNGCLRPELTRLNVSPEKVTHGTWERHELSSLY